MPKPIRLDKDGIFWVGQTIGESNGHLMFGKDDAGNLWIEIQTDNDGVLNTSKAMYPNGKVMTKYLAEWFQE